MGYCINQTSCNFFMSVDKKVDALAVAKLLIDKVQEIGRGGSSLGGKWVKHFSWVDTQDLIDAETLEQFLEAWDIEAENDGIGNITGLYVNGEKLGQEDLVLDAIAPFVAERSYIQMQGEDGYIWRWIFENGKCIEVPAKVEF